MSDPTSIPEDPAVLRAERRLRLLEELSEIGMELARALRPGAGQAAPSGEETAVSQIDPADAFARISRAIRLTLALEAKTDADLRDLKAGVVKVREEARERAAKRADEERKHLFGQIHLGIFRVAEAECPDAEAIHDLMEALEQRLDEDNAYANCEDRPLRETVERLCKDLCLNPDWSRWTDEGWIADGPRGRPAWSPFNQSSPRPLNLDEPAPSKPPAHALE
jgi:hypothetical protein